MKKIYEKMVVTDGKMQYAVELQSNNEKERPTYVIIRNGKIVFENGYFNSISCYDASDETHEIAKQMFISALQFDIKNKLSELKLLESIFNDLGLEELLGSSLTEGQKVLIYKQIKEEVANAKEVIKQETKEEVVAVIKPRAIKKGLN